MTTRTLSLGRSNLFSLSQLYFPGTQTTIFSTIALDSVSVLHLRKIKCSSEEIHRKASAETEFRAGETLRNTNADHLVITGNPSLLKADPLWSEIVQHAKIATDLPELFL